MKLKSLTPRGIIKLINQIEKNIDEYYDNNAKELLDREIKNDQELIEEIDGVEYTKIEFSSDPSTKTDAIDALAVYESLKNLPPDIATNKGIWIYLAHLEGEYTSKRWLQKGEKRTKSLISNRFFMGKQRSRQTILDLWQVSSKIAIAIKDNPVGYRKALELLFKKADIPHRVFEFPNILGNSKILYAIINTLNENERFSGPENKSGVYREVLRSLDSMLVVRSLGFLEQEEVNQIVLDETDKIHDRLSDKY